MTLRVAIGLTPESERVIAAQGDLVRRVIDALSEGLRQGVGEAETHVQVNFMSGRYRPGERYGPRAVAVRSGSLRQSLTSGLDSPLSGYVGVRQGPASRYARTILGDGETTITPKSAKHLWIPVGDNLTRSGQMRMSPREAMSLRGPKGGRLLRIFRSKAGNLVAFLPNFRAASSLADRSAVGVRTGERHSRGARSGSLKGRLLFVLKKSVTVKGTDALAAGVEQKGERIREIIGDKLAEAIGGEGVGGA